MLLLALILKLLPRFVNYSTAQIASKLEISVNTVDSIVECVAHAVAEEIVSV